MQELVRIEQLKKYYKDKCVLDIPNLTLEKGKIYGIIGPNGAGKTTLFRILGGLTFPSSGTIHFHKTRNMRVGIMIEMPYLDPGMTAEENLKWVRILHDEEGCRDIRHILEMVGLEQARRKKVKEFSLGMRQRLGIAMSLIHNPEILILDEPMNGLDPKGIMEIRALLLELHRKGITLIIASHILDELYKISTDFVFLKEGRIVRSMTAEEIEKGYGNMVEIGTDDLIQTRQLLEHKLRLPVQKKGEHLLVNIPKEYIAKVSAMITEHHITILHLAVVEQSLEEYYMKLIERP